MSCQLHRKQNNIVELLREINEPIIETALAGGGGIS
jgi:hypothetical protein